MKGSIVALVTPFNVNNEINYFALAKLLQFHLDNKTDGLLLLGTTAEAESLSLEEKYNLVQYCLNFVNNKIEIMVGIIANTPQDTIKLAQRFKDLKFKYYLISCPYYIKSNESGLLKHFNYIADRCDKPVIIYNVPKRTNIQLSFDLVRKLAYHPNIAGIKEASGDLSYMSEISSICNDKFILYGGDDETMLPALALGSKGIITVLGNAYPKEVKEIISNFNNDIEKSRNIYFKMLNICKDLYLEPSPIGIKYYLYLLGFDTIKLRMPLDEASFELKRTLELDMYNYHKND